MNSLDTDQYTAVFSELDSTPEYDLIDYTAIYDEIWATVTAFAVHGHKHFYIPGGTIDGSNKDFTVRGSRGFEVMLNGLSAPYTATDTGFTLDYAPRPGDYLWADLVI